MPDSNKRQRMCSPTDDCEVQFIEVIDLCSDSDTEDDPEPEPEPQSVGVVVPMFEPVIRAALRWENEGDRWAMVQQWWDELFQEHAGLMGWVLVQNNLCVRKAGSTCFNTRKVEMMTLYLKDANEADALDTVLHEVAHCLAGYEAGHGPEWKRVAVAIGCTTERYGTTRPGSR